MANDLVRKQIMEKYGISAPSDEELSQAQEAEQFAQLGSGLGQAGATIAEAISGTKIDRAPYQQFVKPFSERAAGMEAKRLAAGDIVRQHLLAAEKLKGEQDLQEKKLAADTAAEKSRRGFESWKIGKEQSFQREKWENDAKVAAGESAKKAAEGLLTKTSDLRKEYLANPSTKIMPEIQNSYKKLKSSAASNTAIGDMGVVFAYMKMLDPGSTVREGEYALAENARGVPDTVLNLYNKVVQGERLTPSQRQEFIAGAENNYRQHLSTQQQIDAHYTGLAGKMGMDPSMVIMPYQEPEQAAVAGEQGLVPARQGASIQAEQIKDPVIERYAAQNGATYDHARQVLVGRGYTPKDQ